MCEPSLKYFGFEIDHFQFFNPFFFDKIAVWKVIIGLNEILCLKTCETRFLCLNKQVEKKSDSLIQSRYETCILATLSH